MPANEGRSGDGQLEFDSFSPVAASAAAASHDDQLNAIASALRAMDPDGQRVARTLRFTYDQIYDGRHTGRYSWGQLAKTEKTHFGSLLEINLQREFKFEDGSDLDFSIAGIDVDCKWSQSEGGWMLPPEAWGRLCLVLTADDLTSQWSMGLVRASVEHLGKGSNRDLKKSLNPAGRAAIHWLHRRSSMPYNTLVRLDIDTVNKILKEQRSGQKRINELFRRVLETPIGRGVVATVAQQDDYMKRVRANGGARTWLQSEGIVVFGHYSSHQAIAVQLGLTAPQHGESMSARLVKVDDAGPGHAFIDGAWYRRCGPNEEPTRPAPNLPPQRGEGAEDDGH